MRKSIARRAKMISNPMFDACCPRPLLTSTPQRRHADILMYVMITCYRLSELVEKQPGDYWKIQMVLCYVGAVGTFPFLVFGAADFLKGKQTQQQGTNTSGSTTITQRLANFFVGVLHLRAPTSSGAQSTAQPDDTQVNESHESDLHFEIEK